MKHGRSERVLGSDPFWYKDAVIYELHVRAFADSNGDGIGDFNGLISRLDYLHELGVTALWLLPFYPSPLRDDGYDIADYMSVNPSYGTLTDFRRFLKEAHDRGLRVITELVVNHTSSEHPWFQRARHAAPGSRHRDFYVWSDTAERYRDARIIFQDFENSNWTWDPVAKSYYWHRFYAHQPDLNFDNQEVQEALLKVVDFWMGMGVDGMRLDAVPYLFEREGTNCENLPETHAFLRKLRSYLDSKYQDRMLLAEANQWPEDAAAYFGAGDECHMNFHFPLMPRMFMALHLEDRFPLLDILGQTPAIPANSQWATFLRNHDELTLEMVTDEDRDYMWRVYAEDRQARINLGIRRRLAPLLRTRSKVELLNALLFSLPGTPVLYYGDELGMGDNIYLGDRDGVRTPMQWSPDRNAGFSRANPQRLFLPVVVDPEFHYEAVNVETQLGNPSSFLWWMKRLIGHATKHKAFGRGEFTPLHTANKKVLAFIRSYEDEHILVVANLSRYCQHVGIDLPQYAGFVPEEIFGRVPFPAIDERPYSLSLTPHAFYWFALRDPSLEVTTAAEIPDFGIVARAWEMLGGAQRAKLEQMLGRYLPRQRWFRSKTRRPRGARIVDDFQVDHAIVLLVDVDFYDGPNEVYFVPLALCVGVDAERILKERAHSVIATCRTGSGDADTAVICDGVLSPSFGEWLLTTIRTRRGLRTTRGRLVSWARSRWTGEGDGQDMPKPKVSDAEQTNTSILYGDAFIAKVQRVVEPGINTDAEIIRFLNERTSFRHVPELLGTIEYHGPGCEAATVATVQRFVPNRGDAWKLTLESLGLYCERALAQPHDAVPEFPRGPLVEQAAQTPADDMAGVLGPYVPAVRLLGVRSAELHLALASHWREPTFEPESFTELHQRSLYQSARSRLVDTMELLQKTLPSLAEREQASARNVIGRVGEIEARLRRITLRRIDVLRIRCHGDYHLGQALYTGKDFVILDFEGEPARPISERRFKRCSLRDVAGMLRSFHYAAVSAHRHREEAAAEVATLEPWIRAWTHWISALYLGAYLETARGTSIVPRNDEDLERLLQFYLLEKCIYELGYELNHRPDWVAIPLAGLEYLLGDE